jgi:AcrR family transcriptional regulator
MTPKDRRAAIVDATLSVILRQGIAATSVRDVAREMGTSSGLIHHYFGSMDELLAEAFGRVAAEELAATVEAMRAERDPVARLANFFSNYSRVDEDWGVQLWLDVWADAARRPALQRTSRRLNQEWQLLVVDLIREGVRAGVMTCRDPEATAWRIISLLDGLALQVVAHANLVSREDANGWAREHAETELGLPRGALAAD